MNGTQYRTVTEKLSLVTATVQELNRTNFMDKPVIGHLKSGRMTMLELVAEVRGFIGKSVPERKIVDELSSISNHLTSVVEAMEIQDIDLDDVLKFKRSVLSKVPVINNRMAKLVEETQAKVAVQSSDWMSGLGKIKEVMEPNEQDAGPKILDIDPNIFHRYSAYKQKLPLSSSKKAFLLMELPVLAIFDPFVSATDVEANGFVAKNLSGYVVVEDQLVLAVNTKQAKLNGHKPEEVQSLVEASLRKRTGKKWTSMEIPHYEGAGFVYFWLVTERQLHLLTHFGSKHVAIDEWGFPFK